MEIKLYNRPFLFYTASIGIPWTLWFFVAYLSHCYSDSYVVLQSIGSFLGLITPLLIALVLILPKKDLRKDLYKRLLNISDVHPDYMTIAFLLMPFSILSAQLISLFFGYSTEQFEFRTGYSFSSGIFPVWFLLIVAPIIEELAWYSYGTDCLRSRFNLIKTSLVFALVWGIWHFPLSFIKDYYHSNLVDSGFIYSLNLFISLFPFVIIMNWLYYKANRNILIPIIFHISAGYFNELFETHPMSKVIQTGLLTLISVFLIINNKSFFTKS